MNGPKIQLPSFKRDPKFKKARVEDKPMKPIPSLAEFKEHEKIENELTPAKAVPTFSSRSTPGGGEWWMKDAGLSPKIHAACSRDIWPPEQPDCWVNYCVTQQVGRCA